MEYPSTEKLWRCRQVFTTPTYLEMSWTVTSPPDHLADWKSHSLADIPMFEAHSKPKNQVEGHSIDPGTWDIVETNFRIGFDSENGRM